MGKKGKIGKQRKDKFYHLAKETGYRSRAAFKLIQLNRKFEFLQKSKVLIDLCAAPGGWLQVAQKHMPVQSIIIGVDLAPIKPIHNVITLQEDITTQKCRALLSKELKTWKVDVVLNDGAPNVGKSWIHDAFEQNRLTLSALQLACEFLIKGGWFVTKVFRSKDYNSLMWVFKKLFHRVHATKPQASRNESAEIFVVCQNYIAPDKIDPKFFDATHVFADIKQKEQKMSKSDLLKPLATKKKAKAEGYEDGEVLLYQKVKASDFIQTADYIDLLSKANEIVLDLDVIKNHTSTTDEIVEYCNDLKVLGRKELISLINWRQKVRDDIFKQGPIVEIQKLEQQAPEKASTENNHEMVEPIENELSEEAQKLKRKKRKVAKEKKKIEERMNLKMILKNDQLVQEEQDLFSLKNIKKASQIDDIIDVEPGQDDQDNSDSDTETLPKRIKVKYDKDSEEKYFDPDDSDAAEGENDDESVEEFEIEQSDQEDDEDDDGDGQNGILVDFESKQDKMKNLTEKFFQNDIFNRLDGSLNNKSSFTGDSIDDDDIDLAELEHRIDVVTGKNKRSSTTTKTVSKLDNGVAKQTEDKKTEVFSEEEDSEEEEDSLGDDVKEEKASKSSNGEANGTTLTPEELALGAMMIKSKKSRRDLLDSGWNRYLNEDDQFLPSWFRKEEQTYYRKPTPVSNEMVQEYNQRLREINSKPIKKVLEAKARKKKRALRRLEKARIKAENITDEADMSNTEKAQHIRSIYKKALRKNKDKVQLVVGKKQYGNRRPPGVKGRYKVVDARLKKDKRAENKKNEQSRNKKGRKIGGGGRSKSGFKNGGGGGGGSKGRKVNNNTRRGKK